MNAYRQRFNCRRRGTSAIVVMLLAVPVAAIGFYAISLSNIQRNETTSQISSDLACRWGGNAIARDDDLEKIKKRTDWIARKNWNHGNTRSAERKRYSDQVAVKIEFGSTRFGNSTPKFESGKKPTNSVRVSTGAPVGIAMFGQPIEKVNVSSDATVANVERDICLVIDRSGSMTFDLSTGSWMYDYSVHRANPLSMSMNRYYRQRSYQWWWGWPHPTRSRWSQMIPAVYGLADELKKTNQSERFSIVSYSSAVSEYRWNHQFQYKRYRTSDSAVESNPTDDYVSAAKQLEHKYLNTFPIMGGTNISAGIDEATKVLTSKNSRPNAYKTMIVMTDGQHNRGRSPWFAARDAAQKGIEVYTVTFSRHADQRSMRTTAAYGNGKHFHAPNGNVLEEIFREIANIPPGIFIE